MADTQTRQNEIAFAELRRKIRDSEILSAAMDKLLVQARFTGRISVVVQNGRILKSGYEEGYFTRRQEERMIP